MRRRALVTGGNRGIGKEIARSLAAAGLDVVIGVRDMAQGEAAAAEIGASATLCDLSEPMRLPAEAEAVHVLVNNAGVLHRAPLFSDAAVFDEALDVMVRGPYRLIRMALPFMTRQGYGRIVNISSDWGSFGAGLGGPGAYGIAKAALNALTLRAAREAPACVKVNAVDPGWVRTRMGGPSADWEPEAAVGRAVELATLPEDGPTGGFFQREKELAW